MVMHICNSSQYSGDRGRKDGEFQASSGHIARSYLKGEKNENKNKTKKLIPHSFLPACCLATIIPLSVSMNLTILSILYE
jgi:hypothetical protein